MTCFNCAAPFQERLQVNGGLTLRLELVASIVPPLFRSGYLFLAARRRISFCVLQLCRPFSGAVTRATSGCPCWNLPCFNCAAPFQERLHLKAQEMQALELSLQLCRPFSGAVTLNAGGGTENPSISLQLCRPFSGAVTGQNIPLPRDSAVLQLCRPFSGAVTPA